MVFQVVGFHSFMPSLFYSLTAGPNFGVHLNVQLLFWGDNDCKFTVIEFPLEAHEVHSTNVA